MPIYVNAEELLRPMQCEIARRRLLLFLMLGTPPVGGPTNTLGHPFSPIPRD